MSHAMRMSCPACGCWVSAVSILALKAALRAHQAHAHRPVLLPSAEALRTLVTMLQVRG